MKAMMRAVITVTLLGGCALAYADDPPSSPTSQLPKMIVKDAVDAGYAVPNATTGTKTDSPVLQTPMTVEVLPHQILTDLGIASSGLTDAMAYVGVQTPGWGALGDATIFRGFTSWTTLWNGFRIEDISTNVGPVNGGVWMDNVASLEVLKGPSSILYGRAEPGGAVNVLTKKPQAEFHGEANAGIGSWSDRWLGLDVTGPLDDEKTLRYRLNIADEDSNSWFRFGPEYHSLGVAPALEWRISPQTTLSIEGQYRRLRGYSGEPYMPVDPDTNQPVPLAPSNTLLPGNYSRFDQSRSYIGIDHQFNADWSVAWRYMRNDASNPYSGFVYVTAFAFPVQSGSLTADLMVGFNQSRQTTDATTLDLTGRVTALGIKHTILLGADYYNTRTRQISGWDFSQSTDYFNPSAPTQANGTDYWNLTDRDAAVYLQDQIELPHDWHVLAGARYQHLQEHSISDSPSLGFPLQDIPYEKNVVLPRVGLLWQAQRWLSAYYSYAENSGASNGLDYTGKPIKPEWSKQHEVGAKGEWLSGRLNATLAVFELTKFDIASADLTHPGFNIGVGQVRSRGYEINLQGALTDRWNILLNHSSARPLVIVGASNASAEQAETITAGQLLPYVSNHTFSVWTSYRPPWTALSGWTVGGGGNWVSAANPYPGSVVNPKSYQTTAAFMAYEATRRQHKTTFQLNVNNLFNEHYLLYQGDSGGVLGGNWGTPRQFKLSVRTEF